MAPTQQIAPMYRQMVEYLVQNEDYGLDTYDSSDLEAYCSGLSHHTLRRHRADLLRFATYLNDLVQYIERGDVLLAEKLQDRVAGFTLFATNLVGEYKTSDLSAWQGMTWDLVRDFRDWLLDKGYAFNTIDQSLSTIRVYSSYAAEAGLILDAQYRLLTTVKAKPDAEAPPQPRRSTKKMLPTILTRVQIEQLKSEHSNTPQGCRDRLLMCLLLEHGMRPSEIASLTVEDVTRLDEQNLGITFVQAVVGERVGHILTALTQEALEQYIPHMPPSGPLLRSSRKGHRGRLTKRGMSPRAITDRVKTLGKKIIGIDGLNAQDCRHNAIILYVEDGASVQKLMTIFGWNTPNSALFYIQEVDEAASLMYDAMLEQQMEEWEREYGSLPDTLPGFPDHPLDDTDSEQ